MRASLFTEALVVGGITAVVGFVVSTVMMYLTQKDFSFRKYGFWWQVALALFVTGALIHVLLEVTGMNQKWCQTVVASAGFSAYSSSKTA